MAKRSANDNRYGEPRHFGSASPELTLEAILEEYRNLPPEEITPSEPLRMEEEEDSLSAKIPAEDYAEEYEPDPEYTEPEAPSYEEPDAYEAADEPGCPEESGELLSEEAEEAEPSADLPYHTEVHDPLDDDNVVFEDLEKLFSGEEDTETVAEGYEDDEDFYAGVIPDAGEAEESPAPKDKKPASRRGTPKTGIRGRLVGLLAAASFRRQQHGDTPAPEPEDIELEMPPQKAARHYSAQMPSLKLRAAGAVFITLLLSWITLSSDLGWALPGGLESDLRLCSLVSIVALLTAMLIGLDIVTAGIMSLLRGRPGAESMIVIAAVASLLDAVITVTGGVQRAISFCVIPAAAVSCALLGAWFNCQGYKNSFLAAHHARGGFAVTSETLSDKKNRFLIKSDRDFSGFVRRSEEPDSSESLCAAAFLPLLLISLAISLAAAIGSGDFGAFFHIFAMMTAVCTSFGWLFSFPVLFQKMSRYMLLRGSALAGWSGARDVGESGHLILTDSDIFPEGTVEITGIRIRDKSQADRIISYTGSMLCAAGTGTAAVFTELMRRSNSVMEKVENFTVGDGGIQGEIDGQTVRVGSAGYMYLNGVKVDDKMKAENAVYTAVGNKLAGVFLMRYRTLASVQRALYGLRKARRKPVFATRDFNLEPLLLQRAFGVSTEGFDFPTVPERFRISGTPAAGESPIAGIMAQDGLDALVDFNECGKQLYGFGLICSWAALVSAALGMAILLVPGWLGNWATASAANVLMYMVLWLMPPIVMSFLIKK